jgi:hypothetical protein
MNRDTLYCFAIVDPRDPEDVVTVAAVQDRFDIHAAASRPFELPDGRGRRAPHGRQRRPGRRVLVDLGLQRRGLLRTQRAGRYSVNNLTAAGNDDGSVTVRFGGDGDPARNSLPITEGWNYLVRVYRPRPEILTGAWTFPEIAR